MWLTSAVLLTLKTNTKIYLFVCPYIIYILSLWRKSHMKQREHEKDFCTALQSLEGTFKIHLCLMGPRNCDIKKGNQAMPFPCFTGKISSQKN